MMKLRSSTWLVCASMLLSTPCLLAADKPHWEPISDGVIAQLQKEGKKIGYPGLTAGIAADPRDGAVFLVICDQGLWKSTDQGMHFVRVDDGKIGGRCETGFALNIDPAGGRLACFMIYGPCADSADGGKTFRAWKTQHLDFGAVDWSPQADTFLGLRHESGGVLCLSVDGGKSWHDLKPAGEPPFTALGMFDADHLLASQLGYGIHLSTDHGQRWRKVADAKLLAPLMIVHGGVGYWASDRGILRSTDKGQTWQVAFDIKAVFGPWFDQDKQHLVVVASDGFRESRDGGRTWETVAPLPEGFTVGRVGPNYAWDPTHDIFYASSMGKPAYRFVRRVPDAK